MKVGYINDYSIYDIELWGHKCFCSNLVNFINMSLGKWLRFEILKSYGGVFVK